MQLATSLIRVTWLLLAHWRIWYVFTPQSQQVYLLVMQQYGKLHIAYCFQNIAIYCCIVIFEYDVEMW